MDWGGAALDAPESSDALREVGTRGVAGSMEYPAAFAADNELHSATKPPHWSDACRNNATGVPISTRRPSSATGSAVKAAGLVNYFDYSSAQGASSSIIIKIQSAKLCCPCSVIVASIWSRRLPTRL